MRSTASATAAYRIWMPWRGRNADIIASRERAPALPRNWGASLAGARQVTPSRSEPLVMEMALIEEMRGLAGEGSVCERLLALLEALDLRGALLPSSAMLARVLEATDSEISKAFTALYRRGWIRVAVQRRRAFAAAHRAVVIIATGGVLRSAGAPVEWIP